MARTRWIVLSLFVAAPCAAQTPPSTTQQPATGTNPAMAAAVTSTGPDYPRGRISGYMFGDFYYNVNGDSHHIYNAAGVDAGKPYITATAPPVIGKDLNGVNLRRVYFQLDNDLSVKYSTRFRLEMDGNSLTSDGKFTVAVKNAYILGRSIIPRGDGYFGVLTTPIWENSEEFWGYRSLEKTIGDFRGIGSSADLGLEMKGYGDADHHFGYSAMIGNGNGQKAETDRYKKYYLALPGRFGDLRIEPYVDYEPVRKPVAGNPTGNFDRATYKVFAGYELKKMAVGLEALDRVNHQVGAPGTVNQEPRGLSVFARGGATPTLGWVGRFDHWVADHNQSKRFDSQLYIVGLDWQPYKDVHLMPNIEGTHYIKQGTVVGVPHDELQARITFYYKFSKPQS